MAAPAEQDAAIRSTTPILSWYDRTRPMMIDLVGDYAGKELFLIEGDSLLRQCFSDERIDFKGNDSTGTSFGEKPHPPFLVPDTCFPMVL